MTVSAIEDAFNRFAETRDPLARHKALTDLSTLKALPKQAEDPRFSKGVDAWKRLAFQSEVADEDRLLAVAELVRTSQVVRTKTWVPQVVEMLRQGLTERLPASRLLKDADDRLNLARACALLQAEWLPAYLAQAVAEEEGGEKARAEFLSALVARADSLSTVFRMLGEAFARIEITTEAPGDSMAKRFVRTLAAMRPVLLTSLIEVGDDAGRQFDEWLGSAFRAAGRPREEKSQIDLTREVALTLHDLVRTRFSMATESSSFAALARCRAFFSGISWPEELRPIMELLVQDISEALLMLGRQDVPQQGLLQQLELVCGFKERARVIASKLADKHSELPERIREWLRRGRLVTTLAVSDALQATILDANDVAVGLALIESRKLAAAEETWQRIAGTVEIYEPTLVRSAESYARQVRETMTALAEVANRRGLSLLGKEGEEIEFSSKFFDPLRAISGSHVVIRRPAVVRNTRLQGGVEVVMKGLVE